MSTVATASVIAPSVTNVYAGFWRRVAAITLDGLILLIPDLIVKRFLPDPLDLIGVMIVSGAYYAGFHSSSWQATPGKRYFGIKVTDLDGRRIGLGRAIGRFFGLMLSSLLFGLGCLPAAFTRKRQALHDMICGTLVVNRNATHDEILGGGGVMPLTASVWVVIIVCFVVSVLGAIAVRAYPDYQRRVKVNEVIVASRPLMQEVERAISAKGTWHVGTILIESKHVSTAEITPEGDVVVNLSNELVRGGRLRFTPSTTPGVVQWKCTGENIAPQLLPRGCRQ